jgi:outer membrane protein assembly factor BamC
MRNLFAILLFTLPLAGCQYVPALDDVLPDNRTEYKKSQSLPDLEIPPDLTAEAINDSMAVPGEHQATLSQYQRQKDGGPVGIAATAPVSAPGAEQWVSVRGSRFDVWPRLRAFFQDGGHKVELDDVELGVLETGWSGPVPQRNQVFRYKYKVFSEEGGDAGNTVLFISAQRQLREIAEDGSERWLDQAEAHDAERQAAGALNVALNGAGAPPPGTAPAAAASAAEPAPLPLPTRPQAELVDTGDGKLFLALPEEFTGAFRQTELALQKSGFLIDQKDMEKGTFALTYYEAPPAQEEKGWFSKLAFWKDDEVEGKPYQISLTGVGDKTELIVLNDKGDWEANPDATRILTTIQNQYNLRQ